MDVTPVDVLEFWWSAGEATWFSSSPDFDRQCEQRFRGAFELAAQGKLSSWEEDAAGSLALILLLDQIPRNIFRGTPQAFATDGLAKEVADRAISRGFDKAFPAPAIRFFYLPYSHAEDMAAQERCVDLNRVSGEEEGYFYALIHMDAIRRFGRFPHRNEILGRESTADEIAYLETGGFSA
ncbi:MAG: DUF924 family protein [Pseudomonadota bacterium]